MRMSSGAATATRQVDTEQERKIRLREIITQVSVKRDRDYRLASGQTSGVFFDIKNTVADPEGGNLIGECMLDLLGPIEVTFIGGLEMGAVPVVQAICMRSYYRSRPIRGFFVRK